LQWNLTVLFQTPNGYDIGTRWEIRLRKGVSGIVTLITDFGLLDEYAGAMKGAILKVNPRCRVIDVTHGIEPQDVLRAAFVLRNTYPYYPAGTVHVVVVDPGVGTRRRPVILRRDGHFFVGPDNGVFTFVLSAGGKTEGYEITRREFFLSPLSETFHGRDIFAPVAGHLSLGQGPKRFGPRAGDFVQAEWPRPRLKGEKLLGQILFSDSFGNLITNISREEYGSLTARRPLRIKGKGWCIDRIHRTYGQGKSGDPMALFGSSGLLEIAISGGSAKKELGLMPGDRLIVTLLGKGQISSNTKCKLQISK
jgi:S-adenosyl-L-methionine hydrolase (adenosine-forming)